MIIGIVSNDDWGGRDLTRALLHDLQIAPPDVEWTAVRTDDDARIVRQAVATPSLLSDRRAVVADCREAPAPVMRTLGEASARTDEINYLILWARDNNQLTPLRSVISEQRNDTAFTARQAPEWVRARAAVAGCALTTVQSRMIADRLGTDRAALASACDLLASLAGDQPLDTDAIDALVPDRTSVRLYALTEAVIENGPYQELLERALATGEHPLAILAVLHSTLRTQVVFADLLSQKISPEDAAKRSGLPAFLAQRRRWLKALSREDVRSLWNQLLATDYALKRGAPGSAVLHGTLTHIAARFQALRQRR